MSKRLLIGLALVVMSASVVGAASYTSATVDREASIGVSADDTAIIGLDPGPVDGVWKTNGKLDIELGQDDGLNNQATFRFGDSSDVQNTYAFRVVNNGDSDYTFDISYSLDGTDPDSGTQNVKFDFYAADSPSAVTVDEDNNQEITMSAGEIRYVVIVVDTSSINGAGDLSGTLTISASSP